MTWKCRNCSLVGWRMTKSKLKAYPHWVCHGCGIKAQGRPIMDGMSTYHEAKCDVCGETKAVTQPRDFGYPDFPGFKSA